MPHPHETGPRGVASVSAAALPGGSLLDVEGQRYHKGDSCEGDDDCQGKKWRKAMLVEKRR